MANSKINDKKVERAVTKLNEELEGKQLTSSLEENVLLLQELFKDVDVIQFRSIKSSKNRRLSFCIVYCDGLVLSAKVDEFIMKPLMDLKLIRNGGSIADALKEEIIHINDADKTSDLYEIVKKVTYGDTILLIDGTSDTLILNTKGFPMRGITEPEGERILTGPRDGFTETLMVNLSLIRRRVRTHELKMKFQTLGQRTQTQICVTYIDSLVNKSILEKLFARLEQINIDAVLDENYIVELIKDNAISPFRTTGITERPDVTVAKLLEGRIAVFVDGSPVVMTLPYLFIENFQSNEDYYLNFYYTSFSRLLRIFGFLLTIAVPALYIAVESFHQEMIPSQLLINIATQRQTVPLPASLEALLLLIVFDILRETGVRMPSNMGQALSIVGALVVGQAAVEAKLVSAAMIIVVAITGITALLIPKMNAPVIFIRVGLLIATAFYGFSGLSLGLAAFLVHMLNLKSFGISQVTSDKSLRFAEAKDIFIRAPWWHMIKRPAGISDDEIRSDGKRGKA